MDEEGTPCKFSYENDFYTEFFDMSSKDGKVYVIPRSCDTVVTFINTEMFTKAGVDMSKVKNGWTWDEFMDVCATIRKWMDDTGKKSQYVLDANLTSWLSVCYPMLVSYGSNILSEYGQNIIDCPETKECLEMVRQMVEKRYINDSQVATSTGFDQGGSAMLFQSASISLFAERPALKDKLDLVSFPLITAKGTPKIGAGVAGYAINKQSKNKKLAWAFLTLILSKKGQQKMALNGLNLASIRKDLSDHSTANWGKGYGNINLDAYTYGSEYKTSTDFFVRTSLTSKQDIQRAIIAMFNGASNATKDITNIIAKAKRDIDEAMIAY